MAIICICTDHVWTDKHILINITTTALVVFKHKLGMEALDTTKLKRTRSTALDPGQPGWETFTIHTPISYHPLITNSSIHFDLCHIFLGLTVCLAHQQQLLQTLKVVHYSPNLHHCSWSCESGIHRGRRQKRAQKWWFSGIRGCDQTRSHHNGLGLRFSILDLPTCAAWWALQAQTDHLHFVYFFHTDRWTDRQILPR